MLSRWFFSALAWTRSRCYRVFGEELFTNCSVALAAWSRDPEPGLHDVSQCSLLRAPRTSGDVARHTIPCSRFWGTNGWGGPGGCGWASSMQKCFGVDPLVDELISTCLRETTVQRRSVRIAPAGATPRRGGGQRSLEAGGSETRPRRARLSADTPTDQ